MNNDRPATDTLRAIRVTRVEGRRGVGRFLDVAEEAWRGDPLWVPPLRFERQAHFNPRKNPYFDHAEVALWVAERDGRPVGRISAQVDQAWLDRYDDATGHFGFLELVEDDPAIFAALFGAAEDWLRSRGMRRVTGPFSFSINDESGLLVHGFDSRPAMMTNHARPWYGPGVEARGYRKAKDLLAYSSYNFEHEIPPSARAILAKVMANPRITVRGLDKRHYRRDLEAVLSIFNDAWTENWGYVPLSEAEMVHMARELRPILFEELVAIAEIDGEPVAMCIGLPDLNDLIADLGGRLLPFGWAKLLWRLKTRRFRAGRLPLMGVKKTFQGGVQGGALAFAVVDRVLNGGIEMGFEGGELSWILEDNRPMRHMLEMVGARHYRTWRVYEKDLL